MFGNVGAVVVLLVVLIVGVPAVIGRRYDDHSDDE